MLPLSQTGVFFWSWKQALQSCRKPVTFLPFAGYAMVQLLVLAGLFLFIHPPFSLIFLPLQRALFGEEALHYPNNFIFMPQMFEILNVALSAVLGILVVGWATVLFFRNSDAQPSKRDTVSVRKRYFHLLGAWASETGLMFVIIFGFVWLAKKVPDVATYLTAARAFGVILISAIFAFATALILLENKPFWSALTQSVKMFAGYALVTLFLVGLPTILQLPVQFLLSNSAKIIRRLNPEVITFVIAGGVFAATLSNYFIIGTVTHLYRGISREARAAAPR